MSRNSQAGAVLVFNPSNGVTMDLEENPRRKGGKKRRKGAKKSAARSNPAKKRRRKAKRSNPSHASVAPKKRGKRRAKRSNPSRRHSRRRRNPSLPSVMTIATWTVGGGLAYAADYMIRKIPKLGVPAMLGARAAAGVAVAIGASFLSEKVGAGAFGALGFQLPGMALEGYNYWQATKAAEKTADKLADASKKGTAGLLYDNRSPYGSQASAAAQLRM